MRTRSGQRPVVIETAPPPDRCTLKRSHLRPGADDEPHSCPICLVALSFSSDSQRPAWMQCPVCSDVMHESCMMKWVASATGDTFACPNCRNEFNINAFNASPEAWSADALVQTLEDELDEDYEDDSDSEENNESSESEESDSGEESVEEEAYDEDSDEDEDEAFDEESDGKSDDVSEEVSDGRRLRQRKK